MLRSVAVQSEAELGGSLSVLSRQKRDHVELEALLQRLEGSTGMDQSEVLLRIYRLVFPHAFAEESVLWPVMRRALPDGHELTLEVEREHQEVNELVRRLEALPLDDPGRAPVLDRLAAVLREDVRDEEDELFPRLQAVVRPAQLRLLGVAWEVVSRIAPTRAHPVVARRPPGNVLAALPLSVLDRLRDRTDLARTRSDGTTGALLAVTGTALGRASASVERLPILRIGEDPSTHVPTMTGRSKAGMAAVGVAALIGFVGVALFRRGR
jgi:hemerythrin superfamily protein